MSDHPVTVKLTAWNPNQRTFIDGVEIFVEDVAVVANGRLRSLARGAYYQRAVESVCRWLSPTFTRGDLVGLRVIDRT
jgi:hypothetical protein